MSTTTTTDNPLMTIDPHTYYYHHHVQRLQQQQRELLGYHGSGECYVCLQCGGRCTQLPVLIKHLRRAHNLDYHINFMNNNDDNQHKC
jgi:hypothetical protein